MYNKQTLQVHIEKTMYTQTQKYPLPLQFISYLKFFYLYMPTCDQLSAL